MKKDTITTSILEKIKNTKQTSRFVFVIKKYSFLLGTLLSIIIGSITVAVMIFILQSQRWDMVEEVGGWGNVLFHVLPYFWFVLFVLFIIVALYTIRHVERGYRYAFPLILLIYSLTSIFLGILLFRFGVGHYIEQSFVESNSMYTHMVSFRQKLWYRPDDGLLLGWIMDIPDEQSITLIDIQGIIWNIDISHMKKPTFQIDNNIHVEVMGTRLYTDEHSFDASSMYIHHMPMRHRNIKEHIRKMKKIMDNNEMSEEMKEMIDHMRNIE